VVVAVLLVVVVVCRVTGQTTTNATTTLQYNFSTFLLDVYVQLNMFRASSRPSSGAQQLQ
jgi:hypothetical protein